MAKLVNCDSIATDWQDVWLAAWTGSGLRQRRHRWDLQLALAMGEEGGTEGAGAKQEAGAMTGCASICYRFHAGWLCAPLLVCPCRVSTFSCLPFPAPPLPPRLLTSCNVFCRPGTSSRHAFYLVVVTHSPCPLPTAHSSAHAQDVAR